MSGTRFHEFSENLAGVIDGRLGAEALVVAASDLFPCYAAFAVLNRQEASPVYLADTYPDAASKAAVQRYVNTTYEINPVHNAIRNGLAEGVHRMGDLAPDNWSAVTCDVIADEEEEINFRTPGWPRGLQEASLLVHLKDGIVGEVSLARAAVANGIPDADLQGLSAFLPLFRSAFAKIVSGSFGSLGDGDHGSPQLENFGKELLSSREAEVVQMVLKGHSSLSISLTLGIAIPTVKSHRRNAYAKLGVSTQQELFHSYINWRSMA